MKPVKYRLTIYQSGDDVEAVFEASSPFLPVHVGDTLTAFTRPEQVAPLLRVVSVGHTITETATEIIHSLGVLAKHGCGQGPSAPAAEA